jgi:hypothetical protein
MDHITGVERFSSPKGACIVGVGSAHRRKAFIWTMEEIGSQDGAGRFVQVAVHLDKHK